MADGARGITILVYVAAHGNLFSALALPLSLPFPPLCLKRWRIEKWFNSSL